MRRHLLPLLALIALPAGVVAGCGGGNVGGSASATSTTTSATHAATTASGAHGSAKAAARSAAAKRKTRPKPSPHAFAAATITPTAASQLSKRGQLVLPVATGGPGTVTAFGQAQIAGKGIVHVADATPQAVRKAGVVDLTLTLTPLARAQLAAGRGIDMFVAVSFSKGSVFQREEVHLKP